MPKPCRFVAALSLMVAVLVPGTAAAQAEPDKEVYGLDHLERTVSAKGRVRCPKVKIVKYRGDVIRYHGAVWVYEGFVERLRRFEKVVAEVAQEVYGRKPRWTRHLGTYNCRRMSREREWLSEHAFGNGIDIAGFDFGRLPRSAPSEVRERLPRRLRRPFQVRLIKHWYGKGKVNAIHSRFLRELARRLIARKDIFRVMLGPGYPGHANHFHFDCAPWRIVQLWPDAEESPDKKRPDG